MERCLKLYLRHQTSCPHETRAYRRCPVWAVGTVSGKKVKSLDTSVWDDAESKLHKPEPDEVPGGIQALGQPESDLHRRPRPAPGKGEISARPRRIEAASAMVRERTDQRE